MEVHHRSFATHQITSKLFILFPGNMVGYMYPIVHFSGSMLYVAVRLVIVHAQWQLGSLYCAPTKPRRVDCRACILPVAAAILRRWLWQGQSRLPTGRGTIERTARHFRWPCAIFADTGVFKIRITILKSMQYVAFLWDFIQITCNHQSNTKNNI